MQQYNLLMQKLKPSDFNLEVLEMLSFFVSIIRNLCQIPTISLDPLFMHFRIKESTKEKTRGN